MSIKEVAKLIKNSNGVFALTGAGISTDSGIPDFRSSTGYYQKFDPVTALSREVLMYEPERFYSEGYVILKDLFDRKPNKGHLALAKMEELGYLDGIITQNIDNLHFKAGSKNIFEVHGETRDVHCIKCGAVYPFEYLVSKVEEKEIPPKCEKCGGTVRPNVVMFGDSMPLDFQKAYTAASGKDTLIVVGSSLTVSPVNFFPEMFPHLIIINNDRTPFDYRADFVFHENSSKVLSEIVEELKIV